MGSHAVKAGEHLVRIAAEERVGSYHTLWDHPGNAALKQRRANPNILLPGDAVEIPNPAPRQEQIDTLQTHRFVAQRQDVLALRLTLRDENDQPLANLTCQFPEEGTETVSTAAGELLKTELPPAFEVGVLRCPYREVDLSQRGTAPAETFTGTSKVELRYAVAVGHLDPLDEKSGLQARLSNLGYYAGEIGYADEDAMALKCAIEEFEKENGLTPKGDPADAAMQAKLKDVHGC
jgi:hypothetical protein